MSEIPNPTTPGGNQWLSQAFGAVLAILGGFFAVIFRLRLERREEINHIKTSLTDELTEIASIISKLNDTYNATSPHIIPNTYLNDLNENMGSFDFHKQKLYLISDSTLRKDISVFYKKLSKNINDSINTVGQLGESQIGSDHQQIVSAFTTLATEAKALGIRISNYKYGLIWN